MFQDFCPDIFKADAGLKVVKESECLTVKMWMYQSGRPPNVNQQIMVKALNAHSLALAPDVLNCHTTAIFYILTTFNRVLILGISLVKNVNVLICICITSKQVT